MRAFSFVTNDGYVAAVLNEGLYLGRTFAFEQKQIDAIDKLTIADLEKVVNKYLDATATIKVTAGDKKKAEENKGK